MLSPLPQLQKKPATQVKIYINNCPTRCNTKQSIYYSASALRVSTTPIIRITQNCNYSLRYGSYFLCSYLPPTWPSLATGQACLPDVLCFVYVYVYACVCVCVSTCTCVSVCACTLLFSEIYFLSLCYPKSKSHCF